MKVAVLGLWHLGSVTAACLAGMRATRWRRSTLTRQQCLARRCSNRRSPSPGWPNSIARRASLRARCGSSRTCRMRSRRRGRLGHLRHARRRERRRRCGVCRCGKSTTCFPHLADGAVVLVSSQLPVGTVGQLERPGAMHAAQVARCHSRVRRRTCGLARPSRCSRNPDRVIVGVRDDWARGRARGAVRSRSAIASNGCRSNRRR